MKVIVIAATTVCGRIGPGLSGSRLDRELLERMRAETDASLQGAATLRQGDPEMRGPGGELPRGRIRAVITASGDIPVHGKRLFIEGPPPLIFTGLEQRRALADRVGDRGRVVALPAGPQGLSLAAAVNELAAMGAATVLIEGGGRINYAALAEGIVDELLVTLTPHLSGAVEAPTLADGAGPLGNPLLPLSLIACEQAASDEIFLRYRVDRGRPNS